jgi:photosystem II stability/assembly factor-like uncharacterized protein
MKDVELERRLRNAATAYRHAAPRVRDLDGRILARIATASRPSQGTRRSWPMQLLATAGVLGLALVVAVLIQQARLQTPPRVGSPHPRPGAPLIVTSIQQVPPAGFPSAQEGWVVTGSTLLLTHDGGAHWRDSSPPDASSWCCSVYFLDPARGWAAGGSLSARVDGLPIFRTIDAGTTWTLMGGAVGQPWTGASGSTLDFVDDQHGWLFYQLSTSNGPIGQLQRTSDGGATWTRPALVPAPDAWNYGTLAPRTWIRFIDPATGWLIGRDTVHYGAQRLYITHDGGATWQLEALPVPAADNAKPYEVGLPAFVNNTMVVPIGLEGGRMLLDFSTDRGRTWMVELSRAPIFSGATGGLAPNFLGNGVIAIVLGNQIELNVGNGWSLIRPTGVSDQVVDIEFANRQIGWLLMRKSCAPVDCGNYQFVLLNTTDGGHTWSRVSS